MAVKKVPYNTKFSASDDSTKFSRFIKILWFPISYILYGKAEL